MWQQNETRDIVGVIVYSSQRVKKMNDIEPGTIFLMDAEDIETKSKDKTDLGYMQLPMCRNLWGVEIEKELKKCSVSGF